MGKNKRCRHDRQKPHCKDCNPCPHGRSKYSCKACNPCPHGKLKYACVKCKVLREVQGLSKREVKEEVAVEAVASPTAAALASAAEVRQYLNETVVPILHDGMHEMVRRRPEGRLESVKFLIAHLQAYLRQHGSA